MNTKLQARGPGLYTYEHQIKAFGVIPLPARMTVLALGNGSLVLHSPLAMPDDLRTEIDEVGPVSFVVAPNDYHHLFFGPARAAYPKAEGLVAPGLPKKVPDLAFDAVLGAGSAPAAWEGSIATQLVSGMPSVNEVAFLHEPSRTVVLGDLVFNVCHLDTLLSRIIFTLNGAYRHFGPSRIVRFSMRDRAAVKASFARIFEWDFDRVVMAHGEVMETGGRPALEAAFRFL